jgi:hypothetical protein
MAQTELKYQKELVNATRAAGGYGIKMNNRFLAGVPDLLLKLPQWACTYYVEVKHEDFKCVPTNLRIKLTELQRLEIKKMQAAGMQAGWAVFVTEKGKGPIVVSSSDYECRSIDLTDANFVVWNKTLSALTDILRGVHRA